MWNSTATQCQSGSLIFFEAMSPSSHTVIKPEDIAKIIKNAVSETSDSFTEKLQGEIQIMQTGLKSDISESISTLRNLI